MSTIGHPKEFQTEYFEILFQCSIISEIIYEKDPEATLKSDQFKRLNHGINSLCVSETFEDKIETSLDVKYMICDCSKDNKKRLIIGFRGTSSWQDFLVDLNLIGNIEGCAGRFHSGIYKRSKKIPIEHFIDKLINENENYEIMFTGHSLGAAIASLVTVRVLTHKAVFELHSKKIKFIGFGSPLVACANFKKFIEKHKEQFHFYANENDFVPNILSILTNAIYSEPKIQDQQNLNLIEFFQEFIKTLMTPIDAIKKIANKLIGITNEVLLFVVEALKYVAKQLIPTFW